MTDREREAEALQLLRSGLKTRADRRRFAQISKSLGWESRDVDWNAWIEVAGGDRAEGCNLLSERG